MSLLDLIARLQPSHRRVILFLGLALNGFGFAESLRTPAAPQATAGKEDKHAGADLKLYSAVVEDVRSGVNYYDSANRHLRELGFDVGSTFNWRLPTYAWLFSLAPDMTIVRGLLLAIGLLAMLLLFGSEQATVGRWGAIATVLLLVGVWQWGFDGDAFLAQDMWAAWLITLSLALQRGTRSCERREGVADELDNDDLHLPLPFGERVGVRGGGTSLDDDHGSGSETLRPPLTPNPSPQRGEGRCGAAGAAEMCVEREARFRWLAVGLGLLALFLRELTLPYCLLAAGWAWRFGRRREAIAWGVGIVVFAGFLAWHAGEVAARLSDADRASSSGILGWVQFGGLQFNLLATRMNCFLFHAPGWLIYVYLLVSLVGLSDRSDERGLLAGSTAAVYLLAFGIVGFPKNLYWGLMFSPLLPFGIASAPAALRKLGKLARPARSLPVPQRSPTPISR